MITSNNLLRRGSLAFVVLGLVATALAFTFSLNSSTGIPIKWPAGPIPVIIMLGDTAMLSDGSNYNTSTLTAANTWNAVIGSAQLQSTLVSGSATDNNNRNELAFSASIFGQAFGDGVLAVTVGYSTGNERNEADILFNSARTWDSFRGPTRPGQIDIQRVAIHELGHLFGLNHPDENSQIVTAIMNSRIGNLDTLAQDDIDGARSLYGPPGVPANDAFANATTILHGVTGTITVKGVNTNATKESGEPSHDSNSGGRSVWWRWTAPVAGSVTLDTKGSYYDTTLGVYTGTSVSGLILIASDDDIENGVIQASTVSFNATGGTIYRIAVDGFNNDDGHGADNGGITLNLAYAPSVVVTPVITTQPSSVTVNSGGSASFSVVASGAEPLSYQWLFNTNAISGATNATLNLTSVSTTQAGTYSVTVTNPAGSTTSTGATLTVNSPPPPTPPPTSGGGGGGGGGAPSLWFCAALAALGLTRLLGRRNLRPET